MPHRKLISVVVPMYYEEEVAKECYKRLQETMNISEYDYELIFVNDGSKDKTEEILTEIACSNKNVKVINFSRNFGHQAAVSAGIDNAKGDAVVLIDADLQDPPELILDMIKTWEKGYDVVYAKRKKRKGETWFKLITAKYFYRFLNHMSEVDIPKDTGDFRLMDRKVVEAFKCLTERNRFIRGLVSWLGFNQTYLEYQRNERFAGKTKYPLKKMLKFASDGIIAFSTKPLKFVSKLGFLTTVLSFILLVYSIVIKIVDPKTAVGWSSLMVAITFFSGIQLLSLGIVGEYVARIYDESKNRPLYIIKSTLNTEE